MSTVPWPSGRNRPVRTASPNGMRPSATSVASGPSTSLRCTWTTRLAYERVGATGQQMSGVDAQADPAADQESLDLTLSLDHRAHVRMQARHDASRPGGLVDPVEVLEQGLPADLVEERPLVVARDPGVRGEDDRTGAGAVAVVEVLLDSAHRVLVGIVQHDREEAADRAQSTDPQLIGLGRRIGCEEPLGPELGRRQAQVTHLVEDPIH